jgi:hypothetical protein
MINEGIACVYWDILDEVSFHEDMHCVHSIIMKQKKKVFFYPVPTGWGHYILGSKTGLL